MKFSILIACYNKRKFIKECVQSVLSQTDGNWECIIVDDYSNDGSSDYLDTIRDRRIKVIRNEERLFCSSTYAVALSHAQGDICGILDGDDALDPRAIAVVRKRYIARPNLGFIYTQHHWCNANLEKRRTGVSRCPKEKRSLAEAAKKGRHCFSHWRTFRTELRDKGLLFPEGLKVSVDKNLGFALEELAYGAFLPKKCYFYRYYRGNMSLLQGGEQKAITKRLATKRLKYRKKEDISTYPLIKIE